MPGDTYRAVDTVKFTETIYVLHAFQKKSMRGRESPKHDIDQIKQRLRSAGEMHRQRHESEES